MTCINKYERPIDPPDWYWDGHNEDEGDQDAADAAKEQEWLDEQEESTLKRLVILLQNRALLFVLYHCRKSRRKL